MNVNFDEFWLSTNGGKFANTLILLANTQTNATCSFLFKLPFWLTKYTLRTIEQFLFRQRQASVYVVLSVGQSFGWSVFKFFFENFRYEVL